MSMTKERIIELMNGVSDLSSCDGDNVFEGLKILSRYTDNGKSVIVRAEHDIIYSVSIDDVIDTITEEDVVRLRRLNWMIEDKHCFACFV